MWSAVCRIEFARIVELHDRVLLDRQHPAGVDDRERVVRMIDERTEEGALFFDALDVRDVVHHAERAIGLRVREPERYLDRGAGTVGVPRLRGATARQNMWVERPAVGRGTW